MLRLSGHVIAVLLLVAVIKFGVIEADVSVPKYAGYGGYGGRPPSTATTSRSPSVSTGGTTTVGSHGTTGVSLEPPHERTSYLRGVSRNISDTVQN